MILSCLHTRTSYNKDLEASRCSGSIHALVWSGQARTKCMRPYQVQQDALRNWCVMLQKILIWKNTSGSHSYLKECMISRSRLLDSHHVSDARCMDQSFTVPWPLLGCCILLMICARLTNLLHMLCLMLTIWHSHLHPSCM